MIESSFFVFFSGIQKLVLNGCLGEAIELTYQLFPGILERNPNLLFSLKVRQFIEMINNANNCDAEIDSANNATSSKRNLNSDTKHTPIMMDATEASVEHQEESRLSNGKTSNGVSKPTLNTNSSNEEIMG